MNYGGLQFGGRRLSRSWVMRVLVAGLTLSTAVAGTGNAAGAQAGFACTVTGDASSVVISWTDIGAKGYDVIEDDQRKRWVKKTSTTDRTPGTEYQIVAFGNGTDWTTTTCTNPNPPDPGSDPDPLSCTVTGDASSVVISWTDIGAKGYDVIEDDQRKRWVKKTSTTDRTPGTEYQIVAFGNGTDWTTTTCTNPNPPDPGSDPDPLSCTVTGDASSVVISWTDIGANGYDLIEDDQPKRWITTTTYTDLTPGVEYQIVAFGNGTDWTTTTCTNPNPPDPGPDGSGYPNPGNPSPAGDGVVRLLATGDIGYCPSADAPLVGDYVESRTDALFMALGDIAYPDGSTSDFAQCYDPYFSQAKNRTLPVVGNHEYYTAGAAGHVDYFGPAAGPADKLYYSVDIDGWHIVVLNGECWRVGGCGTDGPQYQWLAADLAANTRSCILVGWHHAYFTSENPAGGAAHMKDYYALLDDNGADILLTGHSHNYERFHRMNADGVVSSSGIRSFVIGTGGADQRPFQFVHNGSVVRHNSTYGVVEFRLGPDSYTWDFVATSGDPFSDSGYSSC